MIDNRKKVKFFTRTCVACPSQWEGSLDSGEFLYIRYRNDKFKAYIAPNEREWLENTQKYVIYELDTKVGEGYDGYMPDEVMKWLLHFILNFESIEGPYEPTDLYDENDII
jgi:hypothetical protein